MSAFDAANSQRRPAAVAGRRLIGLTRHRRLDFRRSRSVAVMKVLLPSLAIALLAIVAAWPAISPRDDAFPLGFDALAARSPIVQHMVNPRLLSVDASAQPFVVTADLATRLVGDPDQGDAYALIDPKADITLNDGTWWALTASKGTFRQQNQVLDLEGDVSLFHDTGYEFLTDAAQIDVSNGSAAGDRDVTGQGPIGTIAADGFRMLDGGERIVFTGKAILTIYGAGDQP